MKYGSLLWYNTVHEDDRVYGRTFDGPVHQYLDLRIES